MIHTATSCAPLVSRSNYSFLCGASPIEEIVSGAKELGYTAIALTDVNNLCGAIRFYKCARELGIKPIIGCELRRDNSSAVVLARNLTGYSNLCKIITRLHLDENFSLADSIAEFQDGLYILTEDASLAANLAPRVEKKYLCLMLARPGRSINAHRHILRQSEKLGLQIAPALDVYFLHPEEFALHRVLTAIKKNSVVHKLVPTELAHPHSFLLSSGEFQKLY